MAIVRCRIRVREMMQLSAAAKGYIRRPYMFDRIRSNSINRTAGGNLTASWQFENAKEGIETGLKDGGKARGLIFDRTRKRKGEKLIFSRDETCYLIYIYISSRNVVRN